MKTKHLLLVGLIVAFSSCTTAYRTGQTPDDVYYSPAPPQEEYVATTTQEDRDSYAYNNNNDNYYNNEDLQIRRGIRDQRYRSNVYINLGFGYNPYDYYSYYNPYVFNNPYAFNPYAYKGIYNPYDFGYTNYGYNSYYSPFNNYYYPPVYFSNYNTPVSNYPVSARRFNLGAYNNVTSTNRVSNNSQRPAVSNNSVPVRTFATPTQPTNRSGVGNLIRRVFTPSNNNTRSSGDNNYNSGNNSSSSRTVQTNTSGSSNSSSSGSSSSAPVRTFRK